MDDQNKIQISPEDMIATWKEICGKKDDEIALAFTAIKAYEKLIKEITAAKDEEIYELQLTIKELKEDKDNKEGTS